MENVFIHPSALVEDGAKIGKGTKIWVNSQIRKGAEIGDDCIISKDTFIDSQVKVGSRVKIQNGVSVYNGVTLEDEVFVGPNVAFTNDYFPRAVNPHWTISPTLVCKGASIGANSTIVCGITIHSYAMIGAGSVVRKDVPAHGLVVGNPSRLIGYVCHCGHRLDKTNFCAECNKTIELEGNS